MIQLKDINKTYNNGASLHVLKGVDMNIEKGEMIALMGASGSGKSTLLNIKVNVPIKKGIWRFWDWDI